MPLDKRKPRSPAPATARLLLAGLLLSPLVSASPPALPPIPPFQPQLPGVPAVPGGRRSGAADAQEFSLRHILHHGAARYPGMMRRLDVLPDTLVATEEDPELRPRPRYMASARTRPLTRLRDRSRDAIEAHLYASRNHLATSFAADAFATDEVSQPNITDKETVLSLSRIAADAYIEVEHTYDWLDVGYPYNRTDDFGWDGDGLRGHIFADKDNSTVIIGLKGTSPAVFDGAETTTNDKVNDNLFFSCCCARVSWWWSTVCDCYSDTAYTCNDKCLTKSLMGENLYYRAAIELYHNVTALYPDSNIWVVGHSLGGAVSSLLGQTFGLPAVTFEAPGEALASHRLNLPKPPGQARQSPDIGIYHFGHTADPIYMGTCNGPTSGCAIGGYAMETRCHAGMECVYDVVSDRGWRMGLSYHRIQQVIRDIIQTYDEVPKCTYDPECVDCWNWKYVTGNETMTTTTTSSVPTTTTTTTTCKTPGWWGCRDQTSTSISEPSTTSPTTTTTTTAAPGTSTTCTSYGWFGNCLDPSPVPGGDNSTITAAPTSPTAPTAASSGTETCSSYGWFGKCADAMPETKSTLLTATRTSAAPVPTQTGAAGVGHEEWVCQRRALLGFGWCSQWTRKVAHDGEL